MSCDELYNVKTWNVAYIILAHWYMLRYVLCHGIWFICHKSGNQFFGQGCDCSHISQEIETMGEDSLEPGFHSLQFESIILSLSMVI